MENTIEAITTRTVPAIRPPTMGLSAQHKTLSKVKKPAIPKPPQVHMTSPAAPKATAGGRRASTSALPTTTSSENTSVSPRTPALQILPMNLEDFKIPRKSTVKLTKSQKPKTQVEGLPPPGHMMKSNKISLPIQQPKPTALVTPLGQETAISPHPLSIHRRQLSRAPGDMEPRAQPSTDDL